MDSFLRYNEVYCDIKLTKVFIPVYFGSISATRLLLWLTSAAFLFTILFLFLVFWEYRGMPMPFFRSLFVTVLVMIFWGVIHHKAVESTYSRFYTNPNKKRFDYYQKNYKYLRYCLFKERVTQSYLGDIDDALAHSEIQFETSTKHNFVWNHPGVTGILAVLIGFLIDFVNRMPSDEYLSIVPPLFVYLIYILVITILILIIRPTPKDKLKEFHLFLFWLKADNSIQETKHLDIPDNP